MDLVVKETNSLHGEGKEVMAHILHKMRDMNITLCNDSKL